MQNCIIKRISASTSAIVLSFILLFGSASAASAQIGGPKDIKSKEVKSEAAAAPAPSTVTQRYEKEGIVVDFSMKATAGPDGKQQGLVAGADAVLQFSVKDKHTGQPITGLHPKGWISSRASDRVPNEAECKDRIRALMGGLLSVRADIDLNSYVLLTLNHDNTVTFINPQISFNITKLENIITLPGAGADWATSKDRDFVYLTLPELSSVAVINTLTRKLVATIPVGEKVKPMRIATQPDGRYVWVGLDGTPAVAVIDAETMKLAATVPVGEGLHTIAFTADSRFAYVTNSAADTVTAIDTKSLTKAAEIAVGKTPVPVAYSGASNFIYAAALNGGAVSVIDPSSQKVVKTVPMKRGVVALRFDPSGRYGFAINQVESAISVIDASTNTVVGESQVVKNPDQVTFSDRYAYVRGTGSEKFSLIDLNTVAKTGTVAAVEIQAGRQPASALPDEIGVADMIAPIPEGNGAIIANTPDQMLYYYVEGMNVPMGTFQNYKRKPHALMLIDRSLSETAPGVYTSPIKLKQAGVFDVPVLVDQPRIANCFELKVAESPDGSGRKAVTSTAAEAMFKGASFKAGEATGLRFRLTDPVTKQPIVGLKDIEVLTFEPPGIWQQRQWAKEVGDGVYEISQTFPHKGLFNVLLRIASRGVRFNDLPYTSVEVFDSSAAGDRK
ncbi:MAG TPA: YncE family protein [Blastocatellia bacterium]|nr:YncE family protein [Blastocatellia bacterium]